MNNKLSLIAAIGFTLLTVSTLPQAGTRRVDLLGSSAMPSQVDRNVVITPTTTQVRVESGETVRFVVGNKSFAWTFHVPVTLEAFALNQIAPPGFLDHTVTAYIDRDQRYTQN